MTDALAQLIDRTQGTIPVVQPLIASQFAPDPTLVDAGFFDSLIGKQRLADPLSSDPTISDWGISEEAIASPSFIGSILHPEISASGSISTLPPPQSQPSPDTDPSPDSSRLVPTTSPGSASLSLWLHSPMPTVGNNSFPNPTELNPESTDPIIERIPEQHQFPPVGTEHSADQGLQNPSPSRPNATPLPFGIPSETPQPSSETSADSSTDPGSSVARPTDLSYPEPSVLASLSTPLPERSGDAIAPPPRTVSPSSPDLSLDASTHTTPAPIPPFVSTPLPPPNPPTLLGQHNATPQPNHPTPFPPFQMSSPSRAAQPTVQGSPSGNLSPALRARVQPSLASSTSSGPPDSDLNPAVFTQESEPAPENPITPQSVKPVSSLLPTISPDSISPKRADQTSQTESPAPSSQSGTHTSPSPFSEPSSSTQSPHSSSIQPDIQSSPSVSSLNDISRLSQPTSQRDTNLRQQSKIPPRSITETLPEPSTPTPSIAPSFTAEVNPAANRSTIRRVTPSLIQESALSFSESGRDRVPAIDLSATDPSQGNRPSNPSTLRPIVRPIIASPSPNTTAYASEHSGGDRGSSNHSQITAMEPEPTPTIQVVIGRVEVRRAETPKSAPSHRPTPQAGPALSLNDYLKQRRGDGAGGSS